MKQVAQMFLTISLTLSVMCVWPYTAEAQIRHPNIVVIVADDMGYADIGIHGCKDIPTPNIDALARAGVRFTDAYVSGPYCSPTRAGLMTGRYPQRFGHEFNIGGMVPAHRQIGLPLDEVTIADRLRAAGYHTALVGKWHLGVQGRFWPDKRGFDEFFGFLSGSHGYNDPTPKTNPIFDVDKNGRRIVEKLPYLTDAFADRAVDFISREKSQPFFLYVAFNAVHEPTEPNDKYLARFPNIANAKRRNYAAVLSAMDDAIGRIVEALRAENIEDNTLLIFFNDNGGPLPPPPDSWNGSSNAPLRGRKGEMWEGAIRVPFIIGWKGHLPEGKIYSKPIIQLDVLPTALAAAGIQVQPQWKLDGVNLIPFLTGKTKGSPHESLYWRTGSIKAIRKGDWKLVKMRYSRDEEDPAVLSDLSGVELYNLKNDISETKNLASKHPQKVEELKGAWQQWNRQLAKPGWPPVPATPVQHFVGCLIGSDNYFVLKMDDGRIFRLGNKDQMRLGEHEGEKVDLAGRVDNSKPQIEAQEEAAFAKRLGIPIPQGGIDVVMVETLAKGCFTLP